MQKKYLLILIGTVLLVGLTFSACLTEDARSPEGPESTPGLDAPDTPSITPETETEDTPTETGSSEPGSSNRPPDQSHTGNPEQAIVFWSQRLKQAFAAALDREAIVDWVFEGMADSAYHTVPPGFPISADPFFRMYGTRDLDLSISLLEEEGFNQDHPLAIDLLAPLRPAPLNGGTIADVIKQQLEDTGLIRVNILYQERESYLSLIESGDIALFLMERLPEFPDPDNWLSPFASCALSGALAIHYCHQTMDEMLQLASSAGGEDRIRLYEEIGDMFAADPPVVPLLWENAPVVFWRGIDGVAVNPLFVFDFSTIQFGEGDNSASGGRDELILGTSEWLESQDFLHISTLVERNIFYNTGLPLMRFLPGTAELIPGAAVDFPSFDMDALTYTFQLREGLAFSDGNPVTSQDFLRAWEYGIAQQDEKADLLQRYVASAAAPDERTLVYTMTGVNTFFPALASSTMFAPLHPDHSAGDWSSLAFTSTGPYRLSFISREEIVLEFNPEYIGEIPSVQRVYIRFYEDSGSLAEAVEMGEIDMAFGYVDPMDLFDLRDIEGLRVEMVNTHKLSLLAFNHLYTPQVSSMVE
jgi:peptide/nickel transport system substrate-binding protein